MGQANVGRIEETPAGRCTAQYRKYRNAYEMARDALLDGTLMWNNGQISQDELVLLISVYALTKSELKRYIRDPTNGG